jgi:hypothetical protein
VKTIKLATVIIFSLLYSSFTFSVNKFTKTVDRATNDSDATKYYHAIGPHISEQNYILMQILFGDRIHNSRISCIFNGLHSCFGAFIHNFNDVRSLDVSGLEAAQIWFDGHINNGGALSLVVDELTQQIEGIDAFFLNTDLGEAPETIESVFNNDAESSLTKKVLDILRMISPTNSEIATIFNGLIDVSALSGYSDSVEKLIRLKYVGLHMIGKCCDAAQCLMNELQTVQRELTQFYTEENTQFFADNLLSRLEQISEQTKQNGEYLKKLYGFFYKTKS